MALKVNYSGKLEAGCDEVGRGCLAGPVVAAAVILPKDYFHDELNDSKQLSEKQRERISEDIRQSAISYSVAEIDHREIDKINIANASYKAMSDAIKDLEIEPEFLLIDGNRFPGYPGIPHKCIVKGDSKYYSIAAASVIAKVYRDHLMLRLSSDYPEYGWDKNAGYATKDHRLALKTHGVTPFHRKSFLENSSQMDLFK